jgi:hypothetical protein
VRCRESAAAERNKQPLAEVLASVLPGSGVVFEIASGTGQHAEHFARAFPSLLWQPSNPDDELLVALAARVAAAGLPNLRPPLTFDVHEVEAPIERAAAILCSNMIHIAPWSACEALLKHASALLEPGAPLVLYGPFMRDGVHTAPSNASFDASLRQRNPAWGVRDLTDVDQLARLHGLLLQITVAMPANNVTVVWRRR